MNSVHVIITDEYLDKLKVSPVILEATDGKNRAIRVHIVNRDAVGRLLELMD